MSVYVSLVYIYLSSIVFLPVCLSITHLLIKYLFISTCSLNLYVNSIICVSIPINIYSLYLLICSSLFVF